MQVSQPNDVKVYNLSAGKSLPEWISDRKKRQLLKGDVDLRRRIELIQHFDMPSASNCIKITPDGNYLLCSGVYKPRLKGFDLNQLSMKFDRCFNSECVQFEILSDDFSKLVLMQADRYIEFHAQYGTYYRTRMPKFGRDMAYHKQSCDLFLVGDSSDVFRLNLELGHFMKPFNTDGTSINVCEVNPVHQLLAVGTYEGKVECFDPRSNSRVGSLDILKGSSDLLNQKQVQSVTALKFKNELEVAVGTSFGHVFIYDIRSNKPFYTKNHQYGMPLKSIIYHHKSGNVLSADSKILKIWTPNSAKDNLTSIEPGFGINDVCVYQNSGLILFANENPKNSVYFVPELGEAPKWCSFLDNITEELEESGSVVVYDDYKFVTRQELEELNLGSLLGTNYIKAYMHGYFIDIRLYHKAKSIVEPFAYKEYKKDKVRQKLEKERANRIQLNKMPKVNKLLATKLLEGKSNANEPLSQNEIQNPLVDNRFAAMFTNRDFEVDLESEEYKLLNPVISKREKERLKTENNSVQYDDIDDEKLQTLLKKGKSNNLSMYSYDKQSSKKKSQKDKLQSLGDLLFNQNETDNSILKESGVALGGREMTFVIGKDKKDSKKEEENRLHKIERKKHHRPVGQLLAVERKKPAFWRGKRV